MSLRPLAWLTALMLCVAIPAPSLWARESDDAVEVEEESEETRRARAKFEEGIAHVRRHEWGRALEAFRKSAVLRPHAVTTYNIAACHRAMGRYTRARAAFAAALVRHVEEDELPPNLVEDSKRYVDEIERLLARLRIRIEPSDARLAIDGAPLAKASRASEGLPEMIAGVRESGPGERLPAKIVEVLIDPGAHVLLLSRKGFSDVALNKTFAAGSSSQLDLVLDRLPAELRVTADVPRAVVEIGGRTVGMAPVTLQQPAGTYVVTVRADGHEPYQSEVSVKPGEEVTLRATLPESSPSVFERWWFWTAAGVVVAGAVVGTYFATRPEPERPPLDGGGLGWTVPLR